MNFQNFQKSNIWWRQIFESLIIHKPSLGSRFDVYWIQTNKQTDKPNLYIYIIQSLFECKYCIVHTEYKSLRISWLTPFKVGVKLQLRSKLYWRLGVFVCSYKRLVWHYNRTRAVRTLGTPAQANIRILSTLQIRGLEGRKAKRGFSSPSYH